MIQDLTPNRLLLCSRHLLVLLPALFGPAQAGAQGIDPTRPPAELLESESPQAAKATAPTKVQAIIISNSERYAVIDGVAVKEGDRIKDLRVIRIYPQSVTLSGDSGMVTIRLNPSVNKTPHLFSAQDKMPSPNIDIQPRRNP